MYRFGLCACVAFVFDVTANPAHALKTMQVKGSPGTGQFYRAVRRLQEQGHITKQGVRLASGSGR